MSEMPPLVSTAWLAERLGRPGLVVLDGTFFLPNQNRHAEAECRDDHIPGASFFDIDAVADHGTDLPHMLPSPEEFAAAVGRLGIDNDTDVVAYDSNDFMASARVWWTFRVFGHDRVAVLDGGIERWKAEGRAVTAESTISEARTFKAGFRPELVRGIDQMRSLVEQGGAQIVDARSAGRFKGVDPEPRPGVRGGHMPSSLNVPYKGLVDESTRCMKPTQELSELFRAAGVDSESAVVTSCGTGVTAAILALALYRLGNERVAVYDGSWTEWGGLTDTPVVLG